MGGIGKTVLATALARDEEVRQAFPDGVLWVTLGQTPQLLSLQTELAKVLGDFQAVFTEIGLGKTRLRELLADKACLLILDDIWQREHAEAFDVLGERCQMLITTRDAAIITDLGAKGHELKILSEAQALSLLGEWTNQAVDISETAREVAKECGYLPLALAMIGARLRDNPKNRWDNVLQKLRNADLEKIRQQFPDYPYPDLLKAIQVSVEALEPDVRQRYLDFAVFPEDTQIPEVLLQTLWEPEGLDEFDTQDVVDELVNKSLMLRNDKASLGLHDLQFDYLRKQTGNLSVLHNRLLNAYAQKYLDGWHTGVDDGYFFQNLAYHLHEAGRVRKLQRLLLDFRWLEAKLEKTNINALLADYNFLPEYANVQLVQGALRLSAHVLNQDKTELATQLWGRLQSVAVPEIQAMLEQAKQWKATPWLRPLTPCLTRPGGALLRTLSGHSDQVWAVALTPDGKHVISGSLDETLKVWNWQTGEEVRTLKGHYEKVWAVALTPDGKYVISGSGDHTLKIWNWRTGEEVRTLKKGHSSTVSVVAVTPDSKYIVSGSSDKTLKVWDWQTGEVVRTLDNSDEITAVVVTPDGKYIISAYRKYISSAISACRKYSTSRYNYTLKIWNWQTEEVVRTLEGHSSVDLTPDGKYVISTSSDNTLKVWNWQTGEVVRTLDISVSNVLTVTQDGKYLISAGNGNLKVWNWQTGEVVRTLSGHSSAVRGIALTPDGKVLLTRLSKCGIGKLAKTCILLLLIVPM